MNRYSGIKSSRIKNWNQMENKILVLLRRYGTIEHLIEVKKARLSWLYDCLDDSKSFSEQEEIMDDIRDVNECLFIATACLERKKLSGKKTIAGN